MTTVMALVVDDEPDVRRVVTTFLARAGIVTIEARDGAQALERVFDPGIGLVLLDLGLPDTDGLELLAQIRVALDVPVVVLTARITEGDRNRAIELGAQAFVPKPFTRKTLLDAIDGALGALDAA